MDAETRRLGIADSFDFRCGRDLECFNRCCRDVNLFLTPYDILRIKRRLNVSSHEFLNTYTFPLFPEEIGHPVILMKMVPDDSRNCPFVGSEGCMIYEDRPWSCRSFPLEPVAGAMPEGFEIVKRDFCMGFGGGKRHTVKKWRDTQNVVVYEEINEEWKKLTHHENFSSRNMLEGHPRDIFFLGSYNIDEFRNVVFKGDFLKFFDVDKAVLKKIRANETELLKFSFRWLRHVLFGDDTMKRK
ncbi:MAG: YkgJ family cysteine cluster protein [Candidatus Sulfobium sp.]|jgi:Fe-S-cluster containining protein